MTDQRFCQKNSYTTVQTVLRLLVEFKPHFYADYRYGNFSTLHFNVNNVPP